MGAVGLVNLSHGGVVDVETCGYRKHDARIAPKLLRSINEGDVVLGDRAFNTYEFISRIITERKAHTVMRLHQSRHRKLDWRRGKRVSSFERIVTWEKPNKPRSGSELSEEEWAEIPDEITLRYIKLGYENRNGDRDVIVVVTDLLDPEKYPGEEVVDLYFRRWEIEVKFRDLKTTMKMEHFAVRSPEMAELTMQMMLISYNLVRHVMQAASHEANLPPQQMSFQGIRQVITSSHESFRVTIDKPRLARNLYEELIQNCADHVLDIRPGRSEPRALKRRPKNYQLLTKYRRVFKEMPHRGKKRKQA